MRPRPRCPPARALPVRALGTPPPPPRQPAVFCPPRAKGGGGRRSPTPQGRSEAPRRQGGGPARGGRALPAAARGPRPRLARPPAAGSCAVSGGAGAQPGGRGPEAEPASQPCAQLCPPPQERIPGRPSALPWLLAQPLGVPIHFLRSLQRVFCFSFSPPRVPFSRMAEAELHKERLQAIAVSPLSFYFLALLSGMEGDPECFGAINVPAQ